MALPAGYKTASNNLKLDSNDRVLLSVGSGAKPAGSVGLPGELYADADGRLLANAGDTIVGPSGGDDSALLQALIADGADILLAPGTFLLNTAPISLAPGYTKGLRVRGSGIGVTTIKLSTAAKRAFDLTRVADDDVFQNIEISDLTVDANNVASTSGQHILLGNLIDGGWSKNLNFQNIAVRRCKGINAPAADTDTAGTGTTGSRQWVSIVGRHATSGTSTGDVTNTSNSIANATDTWRIGATISGTGIPANTYVTNVSGTTLTISENATATNVGTALTGSYKRATQNYVKNILIEDCDFAGGATPFAIMGGADSGGSAVNVYVDNIVANRVKWDRGSLPAATSSSGAQIGGTGYGGKCVVRDCTFLQGGDVNLEIDAMTYSLVDNTTCRDAFNANFFVRNFAGPEYPNEQVATFSNCKAEVIAQNPAIGAASSQGYVLSHTSAPNPPVDTVILDRCQFLSRAPTAQINGQAIGATSTPIRRVVIHRFTVDHTTISYSPGSSQTPTWIYLTPNVNWSLDMRSVRFKIAGAGNTNLNPYLTRFGGASSSTGRFYIDGYEVDYNVTGLTNGNTYCLQIGAGATCTLAGVVKGFKAIRLAGDTSIKRIGIDGTATLTINKKIHISDCDFDSSTAGFEVRYDGTSNAANVFYGDGIIWSTNTGNPPTVASATALAIPDVPVVLVTGTTTITSVTPARMGRIVTLKFAGSLTFTAGASLKLAAAANFAATADDSITLVSDGTNWFEVARSNNA